ncbi:hypothetical protein TWF730_003637 [Orbilia blumenaviensis]|uniref:Uncharacterized protein n=1 Tax=Orbilia blumenaviensis TaxID=1796055 RepID=A0AAV9U6V6_9PEZI
MATMNGANPPPPPPPNPPLLPPKEKKTLKSYLNSITRRVSQKTALGAQHLGNIARSATLSKRRESKRSKLSTTTTTNNTTTSNFMASPTMASFATLPISKNDTSVPRLPNVVYRSPDADFIESHMEAKIQSIGAANGDIKKKEKEENEERMKKEEEADRMGGFTIRLIDPDASGHS